MNFNIIRLHHVELHVTDLAKSRDFYVNTLGLIETEADETHIYLRGIEDTNHHCLVLTQADRPSVNHLAYRVRSEADLNQLERLLAGQGLPIRWLERGEETGQGRALRVQDPVGLPVEFFCEMEKAERMLQQFHLHGGAKIKRVDHVNCMVRDVGRGYDWYREHLGFRCSEYTVTGGEDPELWAVWLYRKPSVHDLALTSGRGPRLHHVAFWLDDAKSILDACDVLAARGYAKQIERTPGRHGLSNAFFVYLRDPDGHRIELYTGDYFTDEPDWEPIRWTLDDPQRATFWGAETPASWKTEASPVQDVRTGQLLEVGEPTIRKEKVKHY
ncbi:3,4-dihydroxyphenylacetate 2,3-dioxygenase [Effusibacillus pohliae]|uniref:3,4-dihydroxyphenylacetate 2,3-dioxygenase n=1 Tax=Effusibacillus pohliae TaxID=232270 RepID=UPI00036666EF|nr:3,4-dihydroxyphenylacetate 2,3-dioxygenase [Effusibacillus pohliae]